MRADRIFRNANVRTLDGPGRAEALAVAGGRLLAVGREADLSGLAGPETEVVDLGGRTVLPGFVESHCHFLAYGVTRQQVNLFSPPNRTVADVLARVAAFAREAPRGAFLQGWGYDDTLIEDRRHLTREDLDAAAPDHPVYLLHISGHIGYANSRALAIGGVTRDTGDPDGGHIVRDARGEPTGELHELPAQSLVSGKVPPLDMATLREAIRLASRDFARVGVTSFHDAAVGFSAGLAEFHAYQDAVAEGDLRLRATLFPLFKLREHAMFHSGFGNERLRLGPIKLVADGSIQGYTAALSSPYHDRPESCGIRVMSHDELVEVARWADRLGFQVATHGNGDAAIESILAAYEEVLAGRPARDHRHRVEHCQMVTDRQLGTMRRLGVHASFFAAHTFYWGDRHERLFIGPERAARIDPLASARRLGVRFAMHSDCPVTMVDPLMSVYAAANRITREGRRLGPDERIPVEDAVRAFTLDAAYLAFEEGFKGSLAPGKVADLVVLSDDPLAVAPETLRDLQVLRTVVGGEDVYVNEAVQIPDYEEGTT